MQQKDHSTGSSQTTTLFRRLYEAERERLEDAMSAETLRSFGAPSALLLTLLVIIVSISLSRWCGPIHAAIGLDDVLPAVGMAALATVTSLLSWLWMQDGRMGAVRSIQVLDFPLWGLVPVAVAWSCSQPMGVAVAMFVHAMMALYWGALVVQRSWLLRCSVLATWVPIFLLVSHFHWTPPFAIATLFIFVISNLAMLLKRSHDEEGERRRLEEAEAREQRLLEDVEKLVRPGWEKIIQEYLRDRGRR